MVTEGTLVLPSPDWPTYKIRKIILHLLRCSKLESAKKKAEISENFDTSNQHWCDRKEITWNGNGRENDLIAKQEPFLKFILFAIYIIAFSYSFLYFDILSNPSATSQKCSIFDYWKKVSLPFENSVLLLNIGKKCY